MLADRRLVSEREAHDEIMGAGGLGCRDDLVFRGARFAEGDVLADRAAEQIDILPDIGGLLAQRAPRHLADRLAVDGDVAFADLVESQQQCQHGGLAATGRADQRGDLAGLGDEAHAVEQRPRWGDSGTSRHAARRAHRSV